MSGKNDWRKFLEMLFGENSPHKVGQPWKAEKLHPMTWAKKKYDEHCRSLAGPRCSFGTDNYNGLNLFDRADLSDPESLLMAKQELEDLDLDLEPVQEEEAKPDLVDLNSFTMGVKIDVNENWKDKVSVKGSNQGRDSKFVPRHVRIKEKNKAKYEAKKLAKERADQRQKEKLEKHENEMRFINSLAACEAKETGVDPKILARIMKDKRFQAKWQYNQ